MRVLWRLMLLAVGVGAFMVASQRPAAQPAPPRRREPQRRRRRIPPEMTAHAAAERWYDEV